MEPLSLDWIPLEIQVTDFLFLIFKYEFERHEPNIHQ
jgi:hypothetical protein